MHSYLIFYFICPTFECESTSITHLTSFLILTINSLGCFILIPGMAFGAGSEVAHRAIGSMFGGSGGGHHAAPAAAPAAPVQSSSVVTGACAYDHQALTSCLQVGEVDSFFSFPLITTLWMFLVHNSHSLSQFVNQSLEINTSFDPPSPPISSFLRSLNHLFFSFLSAVWLSSPCHIFRVPMLPTATSISKPFSNVRLTVPTKLSYGSIQKKRHTNLL